MNLIIYIRVKPHILFSTLIKCRVKKEKVIPIIHKFSCDTLFLLIYVFSSTLLVGGFKNDLVNLACSR